MFNYSKKVRFEKENKPNPRSSKSKDVFMANEVIVCKIYVSDVPNDVSYKLLYFFINFLKYI